MIDGKRGSIGCTVALIQAGWRDGQGRWRWRRWRRTTPGDFRQPHACLIRESERPVLARDRCNNQREWNAWRQGATGWCESHTTAQITGSDPVHDGLRTEGDHTLVGTA